MPLLEISANGPEPALHARPESLRPMLETALRGHGPIILMLHGYKFSPGHTVACPHRHILSLDPARRCRKAVSWPRGLGFGSGAGDEGLAIAFGWHARGTIWQAYRQAEHAGQALARLIAMIHAIAPHRPVHAIAHSLGARVVLGALPRLAPGQMRRAILLAGAEFETRARAAMASPGGQATEVINITSRENDLFDFMLETLIAPGQRGDRTLGLHLPERPNTLTLQLDHEGTLAALRRAGFPVAAPTAAICHWSSYLREGVFPFYRALLREEARLDLAALRRLIPPAQEPRWSRMRALPPLTLPDIAGWRAAR